MTGRRDLDPLDVGPILRHALDAGAPASIRAIGTGPVLGHLRLDAVESDGFLQLAGAKGRESLPPRGSMVMLVIPLGEEIVSLQAPLLASVPAAGPGGAALRFGWPSASAMSHRRRDVQVAYPGRPPLPATVHFRHHEGRAQLLGLTDRVAGLGLAQPLLLELHDQVELETVLPGGPTFRATGQVRRTAWLEGDPLPTRLRIALGCMTGSDREALRRFLQIRRAEIPARLLLAVP